jgi:sn-glycerol 3-phosphate transport system ATP-binding protein
MEQIGTPDEVYHRPATTFVAAFIGSPPMNLVRGVTEGSGFTAGGRQLPLAAPAPRTGELVLGVRPEHVELSFEAKPSGWPVRVQAIEMLGAERLIYGSLGESLFTARLDATAAHPKVGDLVNIEVHPAHMHWFDAATTARVGA